MGWAKALSGIPIVGDILNVGGQLGGAAIQARQANKAAEMQLQGNREALAFQREQEAARKAQFDRAYAMWNAGRNALLQRYGIDIAPEGMTGGNMAEPGPAPTTMESMGGGPNELAMRFRGGRGGLAGGAMTGGNMAGSTLGEIIGALRRPGMR
jgi:hypothetical protein